jgi:tellurite resistance-related uncharacterized protein
MMPKLPSSAVSYFRSDEFTEKSVPDALLSSHATKAGVWARIRVTAGALRYHVLEPPSDPAVLTEGSEAIVEPTVAHRVEVDQPVHFYVEFLRDESVLPPLRRRDTRTMAESEYVDEAGRESFPASDPPSWTLGRE